MYQDCLVVSLKFALVIESLSLHVAGPSLLLLKTFERLQGFFLHSELVGMQCRLHS